MESKFKKCLPAILENIIKQVTRLIVLNYTKYNDTFYYWFETNSNYDFIEIYETNFKWCFLENFTTESERVLDYYAQHFVHAISTYYEMYRDLTSVEHFIRIFITKQFKYFDSKQLYLIE